MGKRSFSTLLALALVAGVFSALPARAQDAPGTIPETVQIDDPKGDANGLNDQDNAYGTPLAGEGDHVSPNGAGGTATDILKVWFTHTLTDVNLNIQLAGNPSNLAYDTYFRFSSNAGEGSVANDTTRGCLQWVASVNGAAGAYSGPTEGNLTDKCNVGDPVTGPLVISEGPDGTFVITVTFPRSYSPLLADGQILTAPFGVSRILYANGLPPTPAAGSTAAFVTLDNTKRGTDYTIAASGPVLKPVPKGKKGAGKNDPPGKGKKKGCAKGKGKKKGACPGKKAPKPPVAATCPPYVPGEHGADAELLVVTDAATAEKPLEVTFDAGSGKGGPLINGIPPDQSVHNFHNIQVNTDLTEAGLYARLEFAEFRDYDLYLENADGTRAAWAGDFNVAPGHDLGSQSGGESGTDFEQVTGIRTSDCGGYTTDSVSFLSEGGDVTLKLWLGEPVNEAGADPGQQAFGLFYSLMGL